MKNYKWNRKKFTFFLEISDSEPLWDNEGVSQIVKLIVSNGENLNLLISTGFGVDYILEIIENDKKRNYIDIMNNQNDFWFGKNQFYFLVDRFEDYEILEGDDCEDFYDWLIQSLSLIEGRKMKIKKILSRNVI